MNKHLENCNAPICALDPNKNYKKEVLWIPGEEVCKHKPYQKFQLKQVEINKAVKVSKWNRIDIGFTAEELETKRL